LLVQYSLICNSNKSPWTRNNVVTIHLLRQILAEPENSIDGC
jgi:hypothetical protein